jgi:predicted lipid-binding transport protein (Tim44 family)
MWELQASTGLSTHQEVSETRFIDADLAAQGSAFLTGLYGRFGGGLLLAGGKGLIAFALTSLETLCLVGRRRFISSRKQHSAHQQKQRNSKCHGHPPHLACAA